MVRYSTNTSNSAVYLLTRLQQRCSQVLMILSENAANILLDLKLIPLNHWVFCRCVSQDMVVQCSCMSQELAEKISKSLCMVVVKLDVL